MAAPKSSRASISAEDVEFIRTALQSLSTQVGELNIAIKGNEAYKQEGIVGKVNRHDEYIEKDKGWKQRFVGATMVVGMLWSYFLKWITK